jgi:hypothetical protein
LARSIPGFARRPLRLEANPTSIVVALKADPLLRERGEPVGATAWNVTIANNSHRQLIHAKGQRARLNSLSIQRIPLSPRSERLLVQLLLSERGGKLLGVCYALSSGGAHRARPAFENEAGLGARI